MNRQIKFRAKLFDTDEWVYGGGVIHKDDLDHAGMIGWDERDLPVMHKVKPGTVGQYTGLEAKNTKVFQDDIIRIYEDVYEIKSAVSQESFHKVVWGGNQYPAWTLKPDIETECNVFSHLICATEADSWEVVGNIHDNPELLKTQES